MKQKTESYLWKNLLNFSASSVALMITILRGLRPSTFPFPFASGGGFLCFCIDFKLAMSKSVLSVLSWASSTIMTL